MTISQSIVLNLIFLIIGVLAALVGVFIDDVALTIVGLAAVGFEGFSLEIALRLKALEDRINENV